MKYKTYKIKDLINEISMGPFGSNIKVECFVDSGIPVLNGSNLTGFALNDNSFRYVTPEKADSLGKANAYRGDIVITHRGTLGQIVFIPENSKHSRYVISQSQFRVKCNEKILPEYLVYYFHTNAGQHKLLSNASQVGVPALARASTTFQTLEIDIPDVTEQRKIVDLLETIREKIELNNAINNNLEQQAQAIFKSWFVDFDPFGGNRPIDWITGIVDDLGAEIICGKTPSTKKKEYYGGNTPFITIPDMHGCVYNVSTERYLSAAGVASQPKKTLPHNTVCISCIGTAGLVTLVSEKSQSNQQINSIVPKEGISAYYIYLLMQTLSETINKLGQSGSTIVNLNKTQFGKIPVPIPSEQVLCNFDTLCKPLFEMILSNQKENIKLANLRDTLLPKLMAGELDVSDLDL